MKKSKLALRDRPDQLQVETDHYYSATYISPGRMFSFKRQVEAVFGADAKTVLEIGPGPGHVTNQLRDGGKNVSTLDIDPALHPDYLMSITDLDEEVGSFDVVCCCQVLEHFPWNTLPDLLDRIKRVARQRVIISLPDRSPYLRIAFHTDRFRLLGDGILTLPKRFTRSNPSCEEHCWEIGVGPAKPKVVSERIKSHIGERMESGRLFEFPYHRFYIVDIDR